MSKFFKKSFDLAGNRKTIFTIAGAIIAVGLVIMLIFTILGMGFLNFGIDFTGGTILEVTVGTGITEENSNEIAAIATDMLEELEIEGVSEVQFTGLGSEQGGFTLRFPVQEHMTVQQIQSALTDASDEDNPNLKARITEYILDISPDYVEENIAVLPQSVDAQQSNTLLFRTMLTLVLAVVVMLGYIWLRFDFSSGINAIIAMMHDVIIMVVVVGVFRVVVNANFIAAAITVLGVSINNTIVVFDRLRENKNKYDQSEIATPSWLINKSVKESYVRTFNTIITTLFTVIPLTIFGGAAIREFTLPIMIGLIAGIYSSLYIAPAGWVAYHDLKLKKEQESEYLKQSVKESRKAK